MRALRGFGNMQLIQAAMCQDTSPGQCWIPANGTDYPAAVAAVTAIYNADIAAAYAAQAGLDATNCATSTAAAVALASQPGTAQYYASRAIVVPSGATTPAQYAAAAVTANTALSTAISSGATSSQISSLVSAAQAAQAAANSNSPIDCLGNALPAGTYMDLTTCPSSTSTAINTPVTTAMPPATLTPTPIVSAGLTTPPAAASFMGIPINYLLLGAATAAIGLMLMPKGKAA